jgi:hypothetical protein
MGRFLEGVQKNEVSGPLRRQFTLAKWHKAFKGLADDDADIDLHQIGIQIHEKANSIRSALSVTTRTDVSATTKLRALVSIANHNLLAILRKTRAAFNVVAQSDGRTLTSDLTSIRIPLLIGDSFSPDELIQSTVDAVQIPIKVTLGNAQSLAGSPKFGTADWEGYRFDVNLGQAYFSMVELWDDCLWNGFRPDLKDHLTTFSPSDHFWLRLRAASQARQENLNLQFFAMSEKHESHIGMHGGLGFRDIQHITKNGRKQVIKFSPPNQPTQEGAHLASLFAYACEPYYKELLDVTISTLDNGTLNELLRVWAVVIRCSEVLKTQLEGAEFASDSENPNSWLPAHAPILQTDVLIRTIAESVAVSYQRATAFLSFLTYRGNQGQELWAQPLVPVGDNAVAPIFAVTSHPNLRRVVDVWLRQLEVDMGPRGPAFERHLRERIQRDIKRSPLLSNARVLDTGLRFRPSGDREEEIDLVLVVGDLVILGEAKCSVSPTEAKQYARHRDLVVGAAAQIQRKATAVTAHRDAFRARLREFGIELSSGFSILAVVVLNDAIHSGMPVNGVPIVDEHIVSMYFSGEIVDIAERLTSGGFVPLRKRTFYSSAKEAAENAEAFFSAPPQFDVFLDGLIQRVVTVPAVNADDWSTVYVAYDCVPVVADRDSLL